MQEGGIRTQEVGSRKQEAGREVPASFRLCAYGVYIVLTYLSYQPSCRSIYVPEMIWTGLDWTGLDWAGLDWIVCGGCERGFPFPFVLQGRFRSSPSFPKPN